MRKAIVAAVIFASTLAPVSAAPAKPRAIEEAIERALAYLHRTQNKDGSWDAAGQKSAAITGLSVMAFLSAGHVPGEGKYGPTVEKGIYWVLRAQREDGLIANHDRYAMYHHGICTLMLAQVAGMSDSKQGKEIRQKLGKAVEVILHAQRTSDQDRGGWGYQPGMGENYADLSIAGWQLLSLRAAKNLGCDVPAERIDRAVEYVLRCWDRDTGGFFYQPGRRLSSGCTGSGILSLELCGKRLHRSPQVLKGAEYILQHPPIWGSHRFLYAVYYCAQAAFQVGGEQWKSYRPVLHRSLLPYQQKNGCWWSTNGEDSRYGPNYGTSMCVLALAVEYRYLPIYQSGEDTGKK